MDEAQHPNARDDHEGAMAEIKRLHADGPSVLRRRGRPPTKMGDPKVPGSHDRAAILTSRVRDVLAAALRDLKPDAPIPRDAVCNHARQAFGLDDPPVGRGQAPRLVLVPGVGIALDRQHVETFLGFLGGVIDRDNERRERAERLRRPLKARPAMVVVNSLVHAVAVRAGWVVDATRDHVVRKARRSATRRSAQE